MTDTNSMPPDLDVLDLEAVNEAKISLKDKFSLIVEFYLEDSASFLAEIDAALKDGQICDAAVPAHTLKSSSRQLGVMQVADIARQIEERARKQAEGGSAGSGNIASLFELLRVAFEVAEPRLKQLLKEAA